MSAAPDILITGGTVVDGTGAPGRAGTVVVEGDRIRLLGNGDQAPDGAARTIDATGKVVAPGFIDLHSHSGLMILAEPTHDPKVRQGITTEVIGVDGNSYAPFASRADLDAFVHLNSGLDGKPDIAYDWDTVASYLGRFDRQVSVNIAYLIGNSALRIGAIGWDDEPATQATTQRMQGMLREGMEEGAFGLSSGLDYPPGSYATTDELAALSREAARSGGFYHTHVRYALGDRFLDPFREAIEIGRRGEAPAHITHFYHRKTFPGTPDQMLDLVDDARATGQDVTFDAYPAEWASTRLLILIPTWVQAGGPIKTKERLADRGTRDRIRRDLQERGVLFAGAGGLQGHPDRLPPPAREPPVGGPDARRPDRRHRQGPRRRPVRSAARRGPEPERGHDGPTHRRHSSLPAAFDRDGRDGLNVRRRETQPKDLRQLPTDPRPVRSRRGAADPGGGDSPDDIGAGRAPRSQDPRHATRRRRRRPRRLRSGDGPK